MPGVDILRWKEGELLQAFPIQQRACYCYWGVSKRAVWAYERDGTSHRGDDDLMSWTWCDCNRISLLHVIICVCVCIYLASVQRRRVCLCSPTHPDINTASVMTSLRRALALRRNEAWKRDEGRQRRKVGREQENRTECATEQNMRGVITQWWVIKWHKEKQKSRSAAY